MFRDGGKMIEGSPDFQLITAAENAGYQIVQSEELATRLPEYRTVPPRLNARIGELIDANYPNGLYLNPA
jgi:hypothetical protein